MKEFFCERCGRRLPPDGICQCRKSAKESNTEKGSALTVEPSRLDTLSSAAPDAKPKTTRGMSVAQRLRRFVSSALGKRR